MPEKPVTVGYHIVLVLPQVDGTNKVSDGTWPFAPFPGLIVVLEGCRYQITSVEIHVPDGTFVCSCRNLLVPAVALAPGLVLPRTG